MPPPTYYDVHIGERLMTRIIWRGCAECGTTGRRGAGRARRAKCWAGAWRRRFSIGFRSYVPLQEERILGWTQRLRNGRNGESYREMDGVWQIDDESLVPV